MRDVCEVDSHGESVESDEPVPVPYGQWNLDRTKKARWVQLRCPQCGRKRGIRRVPKH